MFIVNVLVARCSIVRVLVTDVHIVSAVSQLSGYAFIGRDWAATVFRICRKRTPAFSICHCVTCNSSSNSSSSSSSSKASIVVVVVVAVVVCSSKSSTCSFAYSACDIYCIDSSLTTNLKFYVPSICIPYSRIRCIRSQPS